MARQIQCSAGFLIASKAEMDPLAPLNSRQIRPKLLLSIGATMSEYGGGKRKGIHLDVCDTLYILFNVLGG